MNPETVASPVPPRACSQPCDVACPHDDNFFHSQKLEGLGLMVGEIAHDLNNLLAVILGHAELALDEAEGGSVMAGRLQDIREAVVDAAGLCRGMLAYAGRATPIRIGVMLPELIAQFQRLLRVSVPRQSRLECHVAPDVPPLRGDPSQVRQILLNLIVNAVESLGSRPGRVRLDVDRVRVEGEDRIRIRVADTGCGMDSSVLGQLFQPFFSTKSRGRGLGLAAVRSLTEAMDGTIEVDSEPERGTTFTLWFPVDGSAAEPSLPEEEPAIDWSAWKGAGTVLLADDEPDLRLLGAAMLDRAGLRVLTATDGHEAVECFRAHAGEIDLVFMDAAMPRMDGCEALAQIRQIDPNARIVMISGHTELDLQRLWNGCRPDGVLLKPVTAQQLRQAAMRHLISKRPVSESAGVAP